MEKRALAEPPKVEERDDSTPKITGMAAVFYRSDTPGTQFEMPGDIVERIAPTAFDRMLAGETGDVIASFNHDDASILGRRSAGTLRLEKTKRGIKYEIDADTSDPDHQRVLAKLRRGDVKGSSFTFRVPDGGQVFAKEDDRTVRTLVDLEVPELGPVVHPAYDATGASVRDAQQAAKEWAESQEKSHSERERDARAKAHRARLVELELTT